MREFYSSDIFLLQWKQKPHKEYRYLGKANNEKWLTFLRNSLHVKLA